MTTGRSAEGSWPVSVATGSALAFTLLRKQQRYLLFDARKCDSDQAPKDTPPPSTPSTTAVNVNQTVKQVASKQPAALTREQKGKGPESTVPVPPPTPTATAQKATQQQKGKPSQPSSPPTPVATAQKATWEQKGKAPEFTPPAPPSAPPAAAQKPQEEKAAPEEKVSITYSIRTTLLTSASSSLLDSRKLFIGLSIAFPRFRLQRTVRNRSAANLPWRQRRL
jgi:hypothetical protein